MIEAKVSAEAIRRVYDTTSRFYRATASLFDRKARRRGLQQAKVGPCDRVLEVGSGPGISLRELAAKAHESDLVVGLDISWKMLAIARLTITPSPASRIGLVQGEGTRLPFRDCSFDVVFSAYLLDLLPMEGIQVALQEFRRVLRPSGRLVLVSMTKKHDEAWSWWERLYSFLSPWAAAWVLGGCRPVLLERHVAAAGFQDVKRELVAQFVPSEVVRGTKPGR